MDAECGEVIPLRQLLSVHIMAEDTILSGGVRFSYSSYENQLSGDQDLISSPKQFEF